MMARKFPAFEHHTPPTKYDRYYQERIVSISERDFWSSLKTG